MLSFVIYHGLHLSVNALVQNMFSCDVRGQTFKFPCPNVKFYFSKLLKRKMILLNKKGRNYQKGVPLSRFAESMERTCTGLFFLRSWVKIRVQFQKSLSTILHIWVGKLQSLTPETQTFDVT